VMCWCGVVRCVWVVDVLVSVVCCSDVEGVVVKCVLNPDNKYECSVIFLCAL